MAITVAAVCGFSVIGQPQQAANLILQGVCYALFVFGFAVLMTRFPPRLKGAMGLLSASALWVLRGFTQETSIAGLILCSVTAGWIMTIHFRKMTAPALKHQQPTRRVSVCSSSHWAFSIWKSVWSRRAGIGYYCKPDENGDYMIGELISE